MEVMNITEHKDTEYFKSMKQKCWEAASEDKEINFSELPPPDYKYFSELYWLYNDMAHKRISKEEAMERDEKNYKAFVEHVDIHLECLHTNVVNHGNIRKAGELLSEIEKASDIKTMLDLSAQAISRMTGDENFYNRMKKKVEGLK